MPTLQSPIAKNPLFPAAMPTAGCAYANVKSAKDNGRLCLCPARRRGSSRRAKALIISISDTVIDA
ncbi:hypothetical protein [uncultured Nostoc sp.]|uniref:hypothetical protein n=1 Tax=uncultured Nostoc sp. TaxID=340711 RepID=UPI0035CCA5FF